MAIKKHMTAHLKISSLFLFIRINIRHQEITLIRMKHLEFLFCTHLKNWHSLFLPLVWRLFWNLQRILNLTSWPGFQEILPVKRSKDIQHEFNLVAASHFSLTISTKSLLTGFSFLSCSAPLSSWSWCAGSTLMMSWPGIAPPGTRAWWPLWLGLGLGLGLGLSCHWWWAASVLSGSPWESPENLV